MGTFGGHALPGSMFIGFSLWWTVQVFHRYYTCQKRSIPFQSTVIYSCNCLCGKLKKYPIEAVVKIIFPVIGIIAVLHWVVDAVNGQHALMYFAFGLAGTMDLVLFFKVPLPRDVDYISLILAFMSEFLLFKFHFHGHGELYVLLHTLLLYTMAAVILSLIAELKYRNNVLCALSRAYFVLLQGTWFWQLGWILYPPFEHSFHWDESDDEQMMVVTLIFISHGVVDFLIVIGLGCLMALFHRRFGCQTSSPYKLVDNRDILQDVDDGDSGTMSIDYKSEEELEKQHMLP